MTRTNSTLLAYRFNNRAPNQFTYRLPNFAAVRSDGDRQPCTCRTAGRATGSACRARSATTRLRASARPRATGRPRPRASTRRRSRSPRTDGVNTYQGHLAARRRGLRCVRQRQDGAEVQSRPLPGAGDERHHLHAEQSREPHRQQRRPRSWTDTNKNFVVDCDILNPAQQTVPGGDTCGGGHRQRAELRQARRPRRG